MLKFHCVLAVALVAASALASDRPERNAFVDYRIESVTDLEHQIKTDPAVADRYERHFGMTKGQLLDYVASLHRDRLRQSTLFTVYSVPVDGHVKMHMQRFKAGEPVFSDANGNPVMLVRCGNPLTLGPEAANVVSSPGVEAAPASGPEENLRVTTVPAVVGTNLVPPTMLMATPAPPGEMTFTPEAPETLAAPVVSAPEAPQTFSGGGGGGGVGILPFIPIVGGIIYGIGSGGHSHTPPPVPEPISFLPLAVGVGGLVLRRRRA